MYPVGRNDPPRPWAAQPCGCSHELLEDVCGFPRLTWHAARHSTLLESWLQLHSHGSTLRVPPGIWRDSAVTALLKISAWISFEISMGNGHDSHSFCLLCAYKAGTSQTPSSSATATTLPWSTCTMLEAASRALG